MINDIDTAKSYSTESRLLAALMKAEIDIAFGTVVRNRDGRWTAIFHTTDFDRFSYIASKGFKSWYLGGS